jgi:hypothetical protein
MRLKLALCRTAMSRLTQMHFSMDAIEDSLAIETMLAAVACRAKQ